MVNLSTIQSPLLVQSYRSRNKRDDSGRAIASVYVEKIEFHLTPYLYIIWNISALKNAVILHIHSIPLSYRQQYNQIKCRFWQHKKIITPKIHQNAFPLFSVFNRIWMKKLYKTIGNKKKTLLAASWDEN